MGDSRMYDSGSQFSPNGRWLNTHWSYNLSQSPTFQVVSYPDFKQTIEIPLEKNLGRIPLTKYPVILFTAGWSPDSTTILAYGQDRPGPFVSCDFIVLFNLVDQNRLEKHMVSLDDRNYDDCPDAAWSPDGSMLAIFYPDHIQIVDREGVLLRRIPFVIGSDLGWPLWTPNGIITTMWIRDSDNSVVRSDIYLVNPSSGEEEKIYSLDSRIYFYAHDPKQNYLLIKGEKGSMVGNRFLVFDTQTVRISKEFSVGTVVSNSSTSEYFCFMQNVKDTDQLWIFDWKNHEFKYYFSEGIDGIIDFSFVDGCLLEMLDGSYAVLKPER